MPSKIIFGGLSKASLEKLSQNFQTSVVPTNSPNQKKTFFGQVDASV